MPQLTRTMAPTEPEWVDPNAQLRAALAARMAQEQAPMYSPEEIAQRRNQNQTEYEIGLASMLSGNEAIGSMGGSVLKNALANRQARVNERGSADPLTGKFTYSPDYLRAQQQAQIDKLDASSATDRAEFQKRRESTQDKRDLQRERYEMMARYGIGGTGGAGLGGGSASQVGVGGDGGPMVFRDKSGRLFTYGDNGQPTPYAGPLAPKPSSGSASEDERKAAGWLSQATSAYKLMGDAMKDDQTSASPTFAEMSADWIPGKFADDMAYASMTPARQKFTMGASSLSEAVLRAATGAGQNEAEAKQKVRELTPRWGEHPSVTLAKQQQAEMYIRSLEARAGRALPKGGAGGAANPQAEFTPDEAAELAQLRARFGPQGKPK